MKVSPVNYGGPLVGLDGRVVRRAGAGLGRTATATAAGAEWYDSGIGFAVPLAEVFAVLPRLKEGKDLQRGRLGFSPKEPERPYTTAVTVGTIAPGSPLEKADVKVGDIIAEVGGKPVANFNRFQHAVGPLYAGDTVTLTVRRGDDSREVELTLSALDGRREAGSLGVLPERGEVMGVGMRFVEPDGPAAKAGLQAGDRILKVGPPGGRLGPVPGAGELAEFVAAQRPGTVLAVERKRGDAIETVEVTLTAASAMVPAELPAVDSKGEPLTKPAPGLTRRTNPTSGRKSWVYVPEGLRKGVAPGLVVWLHPTGKGGRDADAVVELWKEAAAERGLVLVGPESANPDGWLASEADEVLADVRAVMGEVGADPARVAVVGAGAGGRMAFHLGFTARDLVRGVASIGAELATKPREPVPGRPLWFVLVAGKGADGDAKALRELGYPVTVCEPAGENALDAATVTTLATWVDCLDRF